MTDAIIDRTAEPPVTGEKGAALLAVGGLAAAFGAAACCALPVALGSLGLGGSWLLGIAYFAGPYRNLLLVVGAACVAGGGLLLWRRRSATLSCAPGSACASRPLVRYGTGSALVLGTVLLLMGYFYA